MNSPSYLNVKRERDHNNNLIDENNKITDKLNEDYYLIYNNINLLNAYAHYICTHTEQPLNEIFIYLVITNKNNYNDYQKILNNLFLPYNNAKSKLTILLNNVHLFTSKENNILSDEYKEKIAPIENIDISKLNEYKWSSIKQILFILSDSSLLSEYVLNNANTPDFCSIVDYSSKKEKTNSIVDDLLKEDYVSIDYLEKELSKETVDTLKDKIGTIDSKETIDDLLALYHKEEDEKSISEEEESEKEEKDNEDLIEEIDIEEDVKEENPSEEEKEPSSQKESEHKEESQQSSPEDKKPKKNITKRLKVASDFSYRNVIMDYSYTVLPYDTFFSSSFHSVCHSFHLLPQADKKLPDFDEPDLIHNTMQTSLKISNNIYLAPDFSQYSMCLFDYKTDKRLIGSFPYDIYLSEYNIHSLTEMQKHYYVAEYISNIFNIRLKELKEQSQIKIATKDIYEINHYSCKFLFVQELPSSQNKILDKSLIECFIHFYHTITKGDSILYDIEEFNGVLYELYSSTKAKDKINFYYQHKCNDLCHKLGLIHPSDYKKGQSVIEDFYIDSTQTNKNNIKVCDVCRTLFVSTAKEEHCDECKKKIEESVEKIYCPKCHELFDYSHYYYITRKENLPSFCEKCNNN